VVVHGVFMSPIVRAYLMLVARSFRTFGASARQSACSTGVGIAQSRHKKGAKVN
jgi:hypothetical protein